MRSQAFSEKRISLSDDSSRSVAVYHEATGVRSVVLAMSHLELIASGPPSRPRYGTKSCTVHRKISTTRSVCSGCSSTAPEEGLTNDCSDGALPDPDSTNNPELNCVFPLHNEFDFASLEGLEGLKVDNIEPQKIPSSSPMATVRSFSLCDPQKRYLLPAEGAR